MDNECFLCGRSAERQCAGCGKVRYCSEKCDRSAWKIHIFDCKRDPSRPMVTAYHLYRSVCNDELPQDPDTRRDYGFDNAHNRESMIMLFGLYVGLLKYREVEPIDLHRWRQEGILVQEIKRIFEKNDGWTKGGYYPWFLQNQHLLDPSWKPPYNAEEWPILQTWWSIGGSIRDTYEMHRVIYNAWDSQTQDCFQFYHLLHSDKYPTPDLESWVTFGFVASGDEAALARVYKSLILFDVCPLSEFAASYKARSMFELFQRYGLGGEILRMPYLRDFFGGIGIKTVWYLKTYVYQKHEPERLLASMVVNYGIINCLHDAPRLQMLKDTYRKVFEHPNGDPLELHKACIAGKIYEYVSSLVKIKKKREQVLRQLMQNMYPWMQYVSPSQQARWKGSLKIVIPFLLILLLAWIFKKTVPL